MTYQNLLQTSSEEIVYYTARKSDSLVALDQRSCFHV